MADEPRFPTASDTGLNVFQLRQAWRDGILAQVCPPGTRGSCWASHIPGHPVCSVCPDEDYCADDKSSAISAIIKQAEETHNVRINKLPKAKKPPRRIATPSELPDIMRIMKMPPTFRWLENEIMKLKDIGKFPQPTIVHYAFKTRDKFLSLVSPISLSAITLVMYGCTKKDIAKKFKHEVDNGFVWTGDERFPEKPLMFIKTDGQVRALDIIKEMHRFCSDKLVIHNPDTWAKKKDDNHEDPQGNQETAAATRPGQSAGKQNRG